MGDNTYAGQHDEVIQDFFQHQLSNDLLAKHAAAASAIAGSVSASNLVAAASAIAGSVSASNLAAAASVSAGSVSASNLAAPLHAGQRQSLPLPVHGLKHKVKASAKVRKGKGKARQAEKLLRPNQGSVQLSSRVPPGAGSAMIRAYEEQTSALFFLHNIVV